MVRDDLEHSTALMRRVFHLLLLEEFGATREVILCDCAARLERFGARRLEYVFLALHTMHRGITERQHDLFARVFG